MEDIGKIFVEKRCMDLINLYECDEKPSFRSATEFDFFRGEAGRKTRPDLYDDGTMSDNPAKKT
eukprot:10409883-Alexandrium_andersonii.AAC.1